MVCLAPWLRDRFDRAGLEQWLADEPASLNTNPYLFGLLVGVRQRVEEDQGPQLGRRVTLGLQSALGALGDGLTWSAWRPLAALVAGVGGLVAGVAPVIAVWLLFAVAQGWLRRWGLHWGWRAGASAAEHLAGLDLRAHARRARVAGAVIAGMLAGALVAAHVHDASVSGGAGSAAALVVGALVVSRNIRGEWAIVGTAATLWVLARAGVLAG